MQKRIIPRAINKANIYKPRYWNTHHYLSVNSNVLSPNHDLDIFMWDYPIYTAYDLASNRHIIQFKGRHML